MSRLKTLAVTAVVSLLALSGAIAISSPAQGAPPGCSRAMGHYEQAGSYIYAYNLWVCDDGNDILLPTYISRYLSPGVYETVASGTGEATYYCGGWNYNVYRAGGDEFAILCS
ncbi:MAG TPA: hypothetical protein VFC19_47265 [Candidatus Limnocylindrales bacterium]|nr:hypothetical protein [Candidatus Limnocylindrales bacterium]